ncbi:fungal-specific transcription factor domain-containing protein [Aspergillus floccosus]
MLYLIESASDETHRPTTKELATRLSRIEHQLDLLLSSMASTNNVAGSDSEPPSDNCDTSNIQISKAQLPTFAGETSISHTLTQIERYLGHREYSSLRRDSTPSLASLPMSPTEHIKHPRGITDTRNVLTRNGIKPDRGQWDAFMKTFCDEVHILYPFLHIASLWGNYDNMWQSNFAIERSLPGQNDHRIVVYLFRLDANERAEKFLAITISHAHHLGFHRSKVILQMSAFNDEMVRRLWWCLHAMDRRLSIETGHPFIIQDVNVDTPQPRDLGDDWLTSYKKDPRTSAELDSEIRSELSKERITPIPYLTATIRYSRVLGKIWETIYGASMTDISPSPVLLQYLEQLAHGAQKEISSDFSANQRAGSANTLPNDCPWWRTKQQMLMRIVPLALPTYPDP